MRILVTGSREWVDAPALEDALMQVVAATPASVGGVTVVHGAAKGADRLAAAVASKWGWMTEPHPALWGVEGKRAGPLRNQRMVDLGADICIAFPMAGSRGTWDCVRRAKAAGIPVTVVPA